MLLLFKFLRTSFRSSSVLVDAIFLPRARHLAFVVTVVYNHVPVMSRRALGPYSGSTRRYGYAGYCYYINYRTQVFRNRVRTFCPCYTYVAAVRTSRTDRNVIHNIRIVPVDAVRPASHTLRFIIIPTRCTHTHACARTIRL